VRGGKVAKWGVVTLALRKGVEERPNPARTEIDGGGKRGRRANITRWIRKRPIWRRRIKGGWGRVEIFDKIKGRSNLKLGPSGFSVFFEIKQIRPEEKAGRGGELISSLPPPWVIGIFSSLHLLVKRESRERGQKSFIEWSIRGGRRRQKNADKMILALYQEP